ncbi:hypothetical protein O6H91_02G081600 [Diphasiastrum complanatum]|uniref:Uncharacterized protein n=2 Tax=Diphasiastrum complanatum TaxID=34168 RepID=A0ACC2EHR9_DIPCM|nr:hypothetical protein O6H91_02G081600 [Diphasiastrum complanatum]KAJ7565930.1 hypothetical protein O6H91_02G081600 [Diphasiastrum complanatum]
MISSLCQQHLSSEISDSNDLMGLSILPHFCTSENTDSEGSIMSSPIAINISHIKDAHQRNASSCNLLDYEDHILQRGRTLRCVEEIGVSKAEHERQLSLIAILITTLRRSLLSCKTSEEKASMDISWPTNLRHVTHVTFDRFNGFLGLPVEFEVEIPRRVPSASASVFGVSPESMQCSFDVKGNSVPTILLLMQERLYSQGGLQTEGIFRIDAENSHEEHVRGQLNKGIVPNDIDLHCLAGLIKAWFRELPQGVLDSFTPEQVMQCHTETECVELAKLLPPTQAALLDWGLNLMADVAQDQAYNKMDARNIAMVFAPNMTQMADPLTALMHAVQVMNLLKTLILRTLKDRQEAVLDPGPASSLSETHDEDNGHCGAIIRGGVEIDNLEDLKGNYEDQIMCSLGHSKLVLVNGVTLINRIDQQSERIEAW